MLRSSFFCQETVVSILDTWNEKTISLTFFSPSISGYRVSPQALNAIIKRYNKGGRIFFDDYVACCVKLRSLTGMKHRTRIWVRQKWPDTFSEQPLVCRWMLLMWPDSKIAFGFFTPVIPVVISEVRWHSAWLGAQISVTRCWEISFIEIVTHQRCDCWLFLLQKASDGEIPCTRDLSPSNMMT